MAERVFVYGTLMRGGVNHNYLKGARYLGRHRTEAAFSMVALPGYPGVRGGGATAIAGEVYEVGVATMTRLDRLEDVPREYVRDRVSTPFGPAWIYLYRGGGGRPVAGGRWRAAKGGPLRR